MFKAIGKYGEYNRYEMELGTNSKLENLTEDVINRLNSIKSIERIRIYVYDKNNLIGRIVDYRDLGDCDPNIPMIYLNNEEYKKWAEKRNKLLFGIR